MPLPDIKIPVELKAAWTSRTKLFVPTADFDAGVSENLRNVAQGDTWTSHRTGWSNYDDATYGRLASVDSWSRHHGGYATSAFDGTSWSIGIMCYPTQLSTYSWLLWHETGAPNGQSAWVKVGVFNTGYVFCELYGYLQPSGPAISATVQVLGMSLNTYNYVRVIRDGLTLMIAVNDGTFATTSLNATHWTSTPNGYSTYNVRAGSGFDDVAGSDGFKGRHGHIIATNDAGGVESYWNPYKLNVVMPPAATYCDRPLQQR